MPDLDYVTLVGRFGIVVGDGADPDDEPDVIWCDEGEIRLVPLNGEVKIAGGSPVPWTAGIAVVDANIDSDGYLSWRGKQFIQLVDLTSDKVNPTIGSNKATHRVEFRNIKADSVPVTLTSATVRIAADTVDIVTGTCDLTKLLPVQTGNPTPIYSGPRGTGITDIVQPTPTTMALELTDGTTTDPIDLPIGPGGSDAGVAGYLATPGSLTGEAVAANIAAVGGTLFAKAWTPATDYPAGTLVIAPGGDVVQAIGTHTSGSTYNKDLWQTATAFLRSVRKRVGEKGQFFNMTGSSMRRLRAAQARAARGGAAVTIALCADSIGQSTINAPFSTNGWFARFQAMVERREGANSQHFTFMDAPGQDDRYTQTGTWATLVNRGWVGSQAKTSVVASSSMTLTGSGTRFSLRYLLTADGGDFTYAVDGAAAVTVSTNAGTESVGEVALTLAAGAHTVVVTKANDTTRLTLIDAEFKVSATGGYRFIKAAKAGQKVSNFVSTAYGTTPGTPLELIKGQSPDLTIIALETNDWGNGPTDLATYKANLKTLIDAAQLTGDVVLVATVPPKEPFISPPSTAIGPYNDVLYDLAIEEDCGLVNLQERWGTYTEAFAAGMMAAESSPFYHPSDQGNWDYAKAMFEGVFGSWAGKAAVALDVANTWLATQTIGHPSASSSRVRIGSGDVVTDYTGTPAQASVLASTTGGLILAAKSGQSIQLYSDTLLIAGKKHNGQNANVPAIDINAGFLRLAGVTTAARPAAATAGKGAQHFDTTLNKPIWSTGAAWVDATGTAV